MSCQETKDLCLLQGSSKTYNLKIVDDDGELLNLTGATITFTLRQVIGGVVVLLKTSSVITEIEILPQIAPTLGQANIHLQPSDTSALSTSAPYIYDVWIDLISGKSYSVIPPSCFLLSQSVRF